jgi:hypothetical protein
MILEEMENLYNKNYKIQKNKKINKIKLNKKKILKQKNRVLSVINHN